MHSDVFVEVLDESRQCDLRASLARVRPISPKTAPPHGESLLGICRRRKKAEQLGRTSQVRARDQECAKCAAGRLVGLLRVPLILPGRDRNIECYTGHPYSFSNEEVRILRPWRRSAIAMEGPAL